jgi:hypothetical protein
MPFNAEAEAVLFIPPEINLHHLIFNSRVIPQQVNRFWKNQLHSIPTNSVQLLTQTTAIPSELACAF